MDLGDILHWFILVTFGNIPLETLDASGTGCQQDTLWPAFSLRDRANMQGFIGMCFGCRELKPMTDARAQLNAEYYSHFFITLHPVHPSSLKRSFAILCPEPRALEWRDHKRHFRSSMETAAHDCLRRALSLALPRQSPLPSSVSHPLPVLI